MDDATILKRAQEYISAATMAAEMTLYNKSRGRSLLEQLDTIHEKYGYFQEILISKVFEGQAGVQKIRDLMENLRTEPPRTMAGIPVKTVKDYSNGTVLDLKTENRENSIKLPPSNVLQFILEDETIVTARPSGTEPKIKFYASCCVEPGMALREAKETVQKKINAIRDEINLIISG